MELITEHNPRTMLTTHTLTVTEADLLIAKYTDFDRAILNTPRERGIVDRLMDLQVIAEAVQRGRAMTKAEGDDNG